MTADDLKQLMETHNLTVKQTAALAECAPSTVYMWLQGNRNITRLRAGVLNRKLNGSGKVMVGLLRPRWDVR